MSLSEFLLTWGSMGILTTGVCWYGTWVACSNPKYWRIGFIVSVLVTMIGSALH